MTILNLINKKFKICQLNYLQGRGQSKSLFNLTCWKIWQARNKLIFNSEHVREASLICEVNTLSEFSKEAIVHFNQTPRMFMQKEHRNISWVKPPDSYVKINCDGAQKDSGSADTGCVLRDSDGKWLIGSAPNIGRCSNLQAEL